MKIIRRLLLLGVCAALLLCNAAMAAGFEYNTLEAQIPINAIGTFKLYADAERTTELYSFTTESYGTVTVPIQNVVFKEPGDYVYYLVGTDSAGAEMVYVLTFQVTAKADDPEQLEVALYVTLNGQDIKTDIENFRVRILKVDVDGNRPLAGAVFDLYAEDAVENGKLKEGATPLKTGLTSDAQGVVTQSDLWEGVYWLVETQSPGGYEKLDIPVKIEIKRVASAQGTKTTQVSVSCGSDTYNVTEDNSDSGAVITYVASIPNEGSVVLPESGGAGVVAIYVVGALLALGAVALLAFRAVRKSREG